LGTIVNGTQKPDIYLDNFTISPDGTHTASLNILLFDDFGLSDEDMLKLQDKTFMRWNYVPKMDALKSWWIFQDQREYQSFVTTIDLEITIQVSIR